MHAVVARCSTVYIICDISVCFQCFHITENNIIENLGPACAKILQAVAPSDWKENTFCFWIQSAGDSLWMHNVSKTVECNLDLPWGTTEQTWSTYFWNTTNHKILWLDKWMYWFLHTKVTMEVCRVVATRSFLLDAIIRRLRWQKEVFLLVLIFRYLALVPWVWKHHHDTDVLCCNVLFHSRRKCAVLVTYSNYRPSFPLREVLDLILNRLPLCT